MALAGPYPSRKRGFWPEGQSPGPRPCAAERRDWRSPLRPSLKRGPHQGPKLGFLSLRIRSLTAASAFRHLVRSPCPAGPDIRLAHSVLWAAPTHASTHVRTCARPSPTWCRGLERRPAPTPRPHAPPSPRVRGGGGWGPEEEADAGEGAATSSRPTGLTKCCRALLSVSSAAIPKSHCRPHGPCVGGGHQGGVLAG